MRTRYGLQAVENCLTRPLLQDKVFSNLSGRAVEDLLEISSAATYEKGAVLFAEGEESRGVFVLGNGRVKLSASSASGKSLILRISEPGEVVGLPSAISGKPYAATAEVLEATQASFIPRDAFLDFLRRHGEAALKVAEILSDIYHATYQEVRYLGPHEFGGGEAGAIYSGSGGSARARAGTRARRAADDVDADPRGDRGANRSFARDRNAGDCEFSAKTAGGDAWFELERDEPDGAGEDRAHVNEGGPGFGI